MIIFQLLKFGQSVDNKYTKKVNISQYDLTPDPLNIGLLKKYMNNQIQYITLLIEVVELKIIMK